MSQFVPAERRKFFLEIPLESVPDSPDNKVVLTGGWPLSNYLRATNPDARPTRSCSTAVRSRRCGRTLPTIWWAAWMTLKVVMEKENIAVDPGYLEWAGVAVFKKTYQIFRERGYRIRLLSAAFRNHMHWSEFIGGDVVISPPYSWQLRFNASDIEIRSRIENPVEKTIVEELSKKFTDFRRAYMEDGLSIEDFDWFGPSRRTLRQFIAACHELDGLVRDFLLPNPDLM